MDMERYFPAAALAVIRYMNTLQVSWSLRQDYGTLEICFKWINSTHRTPEKRHRSSVKKERDQRRGQEILSRKSNFQQVSLISSKRSDTNRPRVPKTVEVAVETDSLSLVSVGTMCSVESEKKSCQTDIGGPANTDSVCRNVNRWTMSKNMNDDANPLHKRGTTTKSTQEDIRKRIKRDKQEYFIRWNGLPTMMNSWVPEEDLDKGIFNVYAYVNTGPRFFAPSALLDSCPCRAFHPVSSNSGEKIG
ncbi:hypothetical protein SNE40_008017 [Patella caerulea]|uniref:Chromo domain-containing protein n=1 Tax=Patella caerulea TaxID=87958 RepID=A0AAN8Q357_PATCE